MSQTKYKMPSYIKQAVVWLCRGYGDALEWVETERAKVYSMQCVSDGMPHGSTISNPTEQKAERLIYIEQHHNNKLINAVDNARYLIGDDIDNMDVVDKLRTAIWESTLDAREYPYELWDLPTIYRDDFYERKRKFILSVAKLMGYM